MENEKRIVNYSQYCSKCKHFELDGTEMPCDECLSEPLNICTERPVNYEEKENGEG